MKLNDAVQELIVRSKAEKLRDEDRELVDAEYRTLGDAAMTAWKPTDEIAGFKVRPGNYTENGANEIPGGVCFTISSLGGTSCELLYIIERRQRLLPFFRFRRAIGLARCGRSLYSG